MKTISDLSKDLTPLVFNPNLTQKAIINSLSKVVNGDNIEIVDPGNPFIFMLDNAVALSACSIEHNESCLRKRYPVMATLMSDLYPHMSDKDHLDLFSQPTSATWLLILGKDEIKQNAVPRDSMGVRKLVIPRDTEFTVSGYTFTMQYGIEIRQMPHGGLQIVYDTNEMSPIRTLATNNLSWQIRDIPFNGKPVPMVIIEVPVLQYKIDNYNESIIAGNTFIKEYRFNDQFFTARVWLRGQGHKWEEIDTAYAPRVINPDVPTAQIMVMEHNVRVSIPDIYIRNKSAAGEVRIDIYSTKGVIDVDLKQYSIDSFKFKTRDIGNEVSSTYYTPLNTFTSLTAMSSDLVHGGRNSLTFQEMKNRLIDNAVVGRKIPVSEKQVESVLADKGFKLTKSIDYVTERIYMASIEMPKSTMSSVSTPVGNINGIISTCLRDLVKLDSVHDNGKRITITPDTLFREHNGMVVIEPTRISDMSKQSKGSLVSKLNDNHYLYSPLHYVVDNNADILSMRAYYMSDAKIVSKQFIETNSTLLLDVNTGSVTLETTNYGYRILITTKSGDTYKNLPDKTVHAQISFTPRGYSNTYNYLNGTLLDNTKEGERVFEFKIMSNMDIDMNHDLIVNNFTVAGNTASPSPLKLNCDLNVIFAVSSYTTVDFKLSNIDKIYASPTRDTRGITQELVNIEFGKPLDKIWSNIRSVANEMDYERWEQDVYATYAEDVLQVNDTGTPVYTIETVDGKPKVVFVYAHRKGDFVLKDGEKILLHTAGSVKVDNGKAIVKNPRSVGWRMELFLFDAMYIFSDTFETKNYMSKVITALLQYLTKDIPEVDNQLLEKTDLYLYPRSTIGRVDVLLADGTTASIDADCKFELFYYLTAAGRQNGDLLKTISRVSRQVILENLNNRTISVSSIVKDVRDRLGNEIVDVEMESIGGSGERLYTVLNESDKLTLGKKAVENPDGTIGIKDDIAVVYTRHDKTA